MDKFLETSLHIMNSPNQINHMPTLNTNNKAMLNHI